MTQRMSTPTTPCYRGVAKPDPEAFESVARPLSLNGVRPEEILFLDGQEQPGAAARRAGWNAIRVDSTEQMARDAGAPLGLGLGR